jgi:hypothetical protein
MKRLARVKTACASWGDRIVGSLGILALNNHWIAEFAGDEIVQTAAAQPNFPKNEIDYFVEQYAFSEQSGMTHTLDISFSKLASLTFYLRFVDQIPADRKETTLRAIQEMRERNGKNVLACVFGIILIAILIWVGLRYLDLFIFYSP